MRRFEVVLLVVVSLLVAGSVLAADGAKKKAGMSLSGPLLPPAEAKARTAKGLLPPSTPTADGRKQLTGLPKADKARFPITDRVWPASSDKPHICLWKDDTLGAYSITIDDNTYPDHEWWAEQGKKYHFHVTWCVITGLVKPTKNYHGTWDDFRKLHALGHDIQSHSVTHVNKGRGYNPENPSTDLDHEYSYSKQVIEKEIPGQRVMLLAYPGGPYQRTQNDPKVAGKYYSLGRGGPQINSANNLDYISLNNAGVPKIEKPKEAKGQFGWIGNITNKEEAARARFYRGWFVTNFHGIRGEQRDYMTKVFEYLNAHKKDIWFGLFREVGMYAMERDTGKIKDISTDAKQISFTLTDDMHDTLFDYPLTVKVRLPDNWTGCHVKQGEKDVTVTVIEHDGAKFALLQVVPDRGKIVLTPASVAAAAK